MSLYKFTSRLERMDQLISRAATGTPAEFAAKLNLKRSVLMDNLKEIKEMGAPIAYCKYRRTYYYTRPCRCIILSFKDSPELMAE